MKVRWSSAELTGIEKHLIENCAILLQTLSAYKINVEKFGEFVLDIPRELTTKYSWYFIHVPDIIQHALVSIGELSEEAAEARNKDINNMD